MIINKEEDFSALADNKVEGYKPRMINSTINFKGKNNVLYCDKNIVLKDSTINFLGDNSVVFLGSNSHKYELNVSVNNNCVFYMDKDNYMNGILNIVISESKNCIIGKGCLFSFGIWIRTADPHLIYDIDSKQRINFSKSIYIGDHVWIGQDVLILKGTNISSGSIIAAKAVCSNKNIDNNTIWGGNAAKKIKENIFWDPNCVHSWDEAKTNRSALYSDFINDNSKIDQYVFLYDNKECISFSYIESKLYNKDVPKKLKILLKLYNNNDKNRFVNK